MHGVCKWGSTPTNSKKTPSPAATAKNINPPLQHQQKTKPLPRFRSNSNKAATAKDPPPRPPQQKPKTSTAKSQSYKVDRHDHPVAEGSKMIGFTRSSLSRVWKLQLKSKKFSHLVLLSRTLGPSNIFVLRRSATHSCKHLFVCPRMEAILPDEGRV